MCQFGKWGKWGSLRRVTPLDPHLWRLPHFFNNSKSSHGQPKFFATPYIRKELLDFPPRTTTRVVPKRLLHKHLC